MIDDSPAKFLSRYLDDCQANGRYTFSRRDFLAASGMSEAAFKLAANRLQRKDRIIRPVRGFYVIIPLEYRASGSLPAAWFIDDLMHFLNLPYYVSLLSAAAIYGAAHQQPQTFQVITAKPHRDITSLRQRIDFYRTRTFDERACVDKKTETGYMKVATPEQLAVDLVQFYKQAGYFSQIATVLDELAGQLQAETLALCAKAAGISHAQRLGYLLDFVGQSGLTFPLHRWVTESATKYVALRPDLPLNSDRRSQKWKLDINETLELDI